jgi:glycyl-tRNA synthetase beta chain
LAIAVKRVVRIVADQETHELDPASLVGGAETALYEAFSSSRAGIQEAIDAGNYDQAIEGLIGLKPHIDRFFDDVMVMSEDLSERHRRLALLKEVGALFGAIASFDRVST